MLFTVIPVKHFTKGKSRLKPLLNDRDRHNLNQKMFSHVLQVAINTLVPNRTIIVSSDQTALNLATESGATTIREQNGQGLNAALELGRSAAMSKGATAILLLPADLPTLMKEDVEEIIELAKISKPLTIIAPDRWDQGTNALLISPPNEIELLFFAAAKVFNFSNSLSIERKFVPINSVIDVIASSVISMFFSFAFV